MLLNSRVSLARRLKLFDATVGNCVLWGTQSWTPRVEEIRWLRTAQNAMLRRMVKCARRPEESWVEWLRRATRNARRAADNASIRDWHRAHLQLKWSWAGHVARMASYRADSWAYRATVWRGSKWHSEIKGDAELFHIRPLRSRRGRFTRWENEIAIFCEEKGFQWTLLAEDKLQWRHLTNEFVKQTWK